MARVHFYHVVWRQNPTSLEFEPLAGVQATVYTVNAAGVEGAIATVFTSRTSSSQPSMLSGATGVIEFWMNTGDYNVHIADTISPARISPFVIGAPAVSGAVGAIDTSILAGTITNAQLAGSITGSKLVNDTITATQIGPDAIGASEIAPLAITSAELATDSVINSKIGVDAITNAEIGPLAVNTTEIADGAVTSIKLAAGAVPPQGIVDGTVTTAKLATDAVSQIKMQDDSVGTNEIIADAVTSTEIATGAVGALELATNAVTTVKILDDNVTNAKIGAGAITNAEISATAAIAESKLAIAPRIFRHGHSFMVAGEVRLAVNAIDVIPGIWVPEYSTEAVTLVAIRYKITTGTSATFKVQRNGSDITGATGLVATATAATADISPDLAIADLDYFQPIITAVTGSPYNMSITLIFEHTF